MSITRWRAGRDTARTVAAMDTMTLLRRRAAGRTGWRRAATMIEFAMILPVFLFMMLFTFDMGTLMLLSGAMNDAAFSAARAGAQVGGAGVQPNGGNVVCFAGTCTSGVAYESMSRSIERIPMGEPVFEWNPKKILVKSGAICRASGEDVYVNLEVDYNVNLLTPGLTELLRLTSEAARDSKDGFNMTASGVARCEVYRTR